MTTINQFSVIAKKAYLNIIVESMPFEHAWNSALDICGVGEKNCPWQTFLGLCRSGDLKQIDFVKKSNNINYLYAEFAIKEWKLNNTISNSKMWEMIEKNFEKSITKNGQLDVVTGLWNFIV